MSNARVALVGLSSCIPFYRTYEVAIQSNIRINMYSYTIHSPPITPAFRIANIAYMVRSSSPHSRCAHTNTIFVYGPNGFTHKHLINIAAHTNIEHTLYIQPSRHTYSTYTFHCAQRRRYALGNGLNARPAYSQCVAHNMQIPPDALGDIKRVVQHVCVCHICRIPLLIVGTRYTINTPLQPRARHHRILDIFYSAITPHSLSKTKRLSPPYI